jgi:hypothetical protein
LSARDGIAFVRSRARTVAPAALLVFGAAAALPAQKLERIGPLADAGATETVRGTLEPQGTRVVLSDGAWCELWLRKSVPEGKNAAAGTVYPDLALSTEIGVIRFLRPAADFRDRALRAGVYSLRYAPIPADGNHLGVSEYPDFLLVVPVADDDPEAKLDFQQLVDRSRRASGTRHPGVLALTKPEATDFPSVSTNDQGHVILQVKAKLRPGRELPLALIVRGHVEQ